MTTTLPIAVGPMVPPGELDPSDTVAGAVMLSAPALIENVTVVVGLVAASAAGACTAVATTAPYFYPYA